MRKIINKVVIGYLKQAEISPGEIGVPETLISNGIKKYLSEYRDDVVSYVLGEIEGDILNVAREKGSLDAKLDAEQWKMIINQQLDRTIENIDEGSI